MTFDEESKAVQEIAKTARQAMQTAEKTGGFLAKFIDGPMSQMSGALEDRLRYWRWERQVRLTVRADVFLKEMGVEHPTRRLPPNIALPLIEAAVLEEDDELQDMWARLLANAANKDSGVEVRQLLISVLKDMGNIEVAILNKIVNAPKEFIYGDKYVNTQQLPGDYFRSPTDAMGAEPPEHIQVAVWNLSRLGCVELVSGFGGTFVNGAAPTALGRLLVRACTIKGS